MDNWCVNVKWAICGHYFFRRNSYTVSRLYETRTVMSNVKFAIAVRSPVLSPVKWPIKKKIYIRYD